MRTSTGRRRDQYWLLFALREGGWTKGWRRGGEGASGSGSSAGRWWGFVGWFAGQNGR